MDLSRDLGTDPGVAGTEEQGAQAGVPIVPQIVTYVYTQDGVRVNRPCTPEEILGLTCDSPDCQVNGCAIVNCTTDPSHPGAFEAIADEVLAGTLYGPAPDGQSRAQVGGNFPKLSPGAFPKFWPLPSLLLEADSSQWQTGGGIASASRD